MTKMEIFSHTGIGRSRMTNTWTWKDIRFIFDLLNVLQVKRAKVLNVSTSTVNKCEVIDNFTIRTLELQLSSLKQQ